MKATEADRFVNSAYVVFTVLLLLRVCIHLTFDSISDYVHVYIQDYWLGYIYDVHVNT